MAFSILNPVQFFRMLMVSGCLLAVIDLPGQIVKWGPGDYDPNRENPRIPILLNQAADYGFQLEFPLSPVGAFPSDQYKAPADMSATFYGALAVDVENGRRIRSAVVSDGDASRVRVYSNKGMGDRSDRMGGLFLFLRPDFLDPKARLGGQTRVTVNVFSENNGDVNWHVVLKVGDSYYLSNRMDAEKTPSQQSRTLGEVTWGDYAPADAVLPAAEASEVSPDLSKVDGIGFLAYTSGQGADSQLRLVWNEFQVENP